MLFRKQDKGIRLELFMVQVLLTIMYGSILWYLYTKDPSYPIPMVGLSLAMYLLTREYVIKKRDTIHVFFLPYLLVVMISYSASIYLISSTPAETLLGNIWLYLSFLVFSTFIPLFYQIFRNHLGLKEFY